MSETWKLLMCTHSYFVTLKDWQRENLHYVGAFVSAVRRFSEQREGADTPRI